MEPVSLVRFKLAPPPTFRDLSLCFYSLKNGAVPRLFGMQSVSRDVLPASMWARFLKPVSRAEMKCTDSCKPRLSNVRFRPIADIRTQCESGPVLGFALSVLSATIAPQYQAVPLHIRPTYGCNLSVVRWLRPGHRLLVRRGPTIGHRVIARLDEGSRVYICNEGGGWYGIAFSSPSKPCGHQTFRSLDVRAAARCRSGWVRDKWIDILTG